MKKNKLAGSLGALLIAAGAGCTTIDEHVRVADWPELEVIEHYVSYPEMREHCAKYAGPLMTPLGCTEFDFDAGEAHIYVTPELPMRSVLRHERMHAAGYDHVGSDHMAQLWHAWRAHHAGAQTRIAAAPADGGVAAAQLLR